VAGACVYGNERLGPIKDGKFLDQMIDCQLFKKDSAIWSECVTNQNKIRLTTSELYRHTYRI